MSTCEYEPCSRHFHAGNRLWHRFCSEKCRCRMAYLRRTRGRALAACKVCGHEFVRCQQQKTYCSDMCWAIAYKRPRRVKKAI